MYQERQPDSPTHSHADTPPQITKQLICYQQLLNEPHRASHSLAATTKWGKKTTPTAAAMATTFLIYYNVCNSQPFSHSLSLSRCVCASETVPFPDLNCPFFSTEMFNIAVCLSFCNLFSFFGLQKVSQCAV